MNKIFELTTSIKLFDTDAAGMLFFANQLRLVHEAYEGFLVSKQRGLDYIIAEAPYLLPVVHAQTNFSASLLPGEQVRIDLSLLKTGNTSFTVGHEIFKRDGTVAGHGHVVHVCVDKKTRQKIPIPPDIHAILTSDSNPG